MNSNPYQRDIIINHSPYKLMLTVCHFLLVCLFFEIFEICRGKRNNIFPLATHIFRNLFWKICPRFKQILMTCLKCSRASFLPSSTNERMLWGRGWLKMKPKTKDVGTVLYMESKPQKLDSKVQKQRLRKHVKDENRNQGS